MIDPKQSARRAGLHYVQAGGPGISRIVNGKSASYKTSNGKPLRDKAQLERIRALVIPPAWTNVWISEDPDSHLQAIGTDARGRRQYRYHPGYREIRDLTKYNRMSDFGCCLPAIRKRINADLSLPGLPREKVLATLVKLLDETAIRVGNSEYAKSNKSFGLTTLRDKHAKISGSKLEFHFKGKSGVEHRIQLQDPRLARIVRNCQEIPGQHLFQYIGEDGQPAAIHSHDVNAYLREISGHDFTAKDFRTWNGTRHAIAALAKLGPAESETLANKNLVAAIKMVAEVLGNRPATCRKYYIHPAVVEAYVSGSLEIRTGSRRATFSWEERTILKLAAR